MDDALFDVVHARLLLRFPELVEALGGDPAALFARGGIDPQGPATYRQMVALIDLAANALGCNDFGMRLGKLQSRAGMFGPLGSVMRNSRTFGEAIAYAGSHNYAHSLGASIWLRRLPDGEGVFVGHDILLGALANRAQAIEQILLDGHLTALEITGGHARARRVHFRHQPISPRRAYRRYFGCEVRFGQHEDGVLFFERDLARPITTADGPAFEAAVRVVEGFTRHRPPLHAETRGLVMRYLASGDCGNDRIAAELKLHPRTMHRQLVAEGTSFQRVKDEVRADMMRYLLEQTDLDFAAITERLGFAEQSVFTRNCRKRFALSPTQIRARLRAKLV
jgi:AraC-like DNA-binding protein